MKVLVISCSLNPASRSARLAEHAMRVLGGEGVDVTFIDLRDREMPLCAGRASGQQCEAQALAEQILQADALLLAMPVYNFGANAAAKNMIELTGRAWTGKLVGFLCAAGGPSSYMSMMSMANSLMLDFRCLVVPRFVYAMKDAFEEETYQLRPPIDARVRELCAELVRIGGALAQTEPARPREGV